MTNEAKANSTESELKLVETRLVSANFQFLSPLQAGPIELTGSSLNPISKVSKAAKEIRVFLNFNSTPQEKGRDLFKIEASYYGLFKASEGTSDDDVLAFAKANAPAIVFPLLRAAISTLTLASGFPPLTLPIVNFYKTAVTVTVTD